MLLERARTTWSEWRSSSRQGEGWRKGQRHPEGCTSISPTLKLLSFNIQAGIGSQRYHQYVTGSWKHVLGHGQSVANIEAIADVVQRYDVVGLQEADGGSLRSRNVNQVTHLAQLAGFSFWHQQLNRNLGRLGQFSNGLLSRLTPYYVEDHRLPGMPGRGAIISKYGHPDEPLVVAVVHLALGEKNRMRQMAYLGEHLHHHSHVVVMGDFNCLPAEVTASPLAQMGLRPGAAGLHSYPSWNPDRPIDHILVSQTVAVKRAEVLNHCRMSDHLPIATEIQLPDAVIESAKHAPLALENRK